MDVTENQTAPQKNVQTYILAIICLVLGITVGYLMRAPSVSASRSTAQQTAPPEVHGASGAMPTPDQMQHMVEKAAEPILAALQKEPDNPELLAKAGSVYFRAQQFPTAAQYYERAAKVKPTAEGFVALSNAYHYAGADDQAIDSLNRALQIDPKSANALFNLGMLNWRVKNDPNAAIAAWERVLKTNPKHPHRADVENMIAKAKKHIGMAANTKTTKSAM
jgi:cytochrome c-type biogenesis protein CcmH/NrfG